MGSSSTTLEVIAGTFGIVLIALPFAVAVGLPLVVILGGVMAFAAMRWAAICSPAAWAISGLFGASVIWLVLGGPSKNYPDGIILAVCATLVGLVTALVFWRVWINRD